MIVDYERDHFSVGQALHPSTSVAQDLVAIEPYIKISPKKNNNTGAENRGSLSRTFLSHGEIAGVVIGSVVALAILISSVLLTVRRRWQARTSTALAPSDLLDRPKYDLKDPTLVQTSVNRTAVHEMDQKNAILRELDNGGSRHELHVEERAAELVDIQSKISAAELEGN